MIALQTIACASAQDGACTPADCVVRLHAPTRAEFQQHLNGDRVVVMTGVSDNAQTTTWDLNGEAMREAWGVHMKDEDAYNIAVNGGGRGGNVSAHKTLKEYLEAMKQPRWSETENFAFDLGNFFASEGGVAFGQKLNHMGQEDLGLPTKTNKLILSLGGEGHGISFHWHLAAWLELLAGKKHWCRGVELANLLTPRLLTRRLTLRISLQVGGRAWRARHVRHHARR
jgi:hypothetical protein